MTPRQPSPRLARAALAGAAAIAVVGALAGPAHAADQLPRQVAAGQIATVAGGVGGPAKGTTVALNTPCGVLAAGKNLDAMDFSTVRRISEQDGLLTTLAGTGAFAGPVGDGGPATQATLFGGCSAALDHKGNLVVADTNAFRIQVVAAQTGTFYGQAMTAGDIYTVAGNGAQGFSGDGGPATAAEMNFPDGVAVDGAGNLIIADHNNNRIRVVAAHTGTFYGMAMTGGDIYSVAGGGTSFPGDGVRATDAQLNGPVQVTLDAAGNLLLNDQGSEAIQVVAKTSGTFYGQAMKAHFIYIIAGRGSSLADGVPATTAHIFPLGIGLDHSGNLLIADGQTLKIRVVAATSGTFYGQAMTAEDIYSVAGGGTNGLGDGGPATAATFGEPQAVTVDSAGNLVIADERFDRIRVVAEATARFYGRAMTAGDIYTVAGNGFGQTAIFSGDGGAATAARLDNPAQTTVDGAQNLIIADTINSRIRVVAAASGTFYGQAMTAGDIYTVAGRRPAGFSGDGGPATSAQLNQPRAVAVDTAGNLVIADSFNSRIRVVAAATGTFYGQAMTAGDIYAVAGNGTAAFSGDGGLATAAELNRPGGVTVDGAGNLVIADGHNNRIRVVAAATGTFYGQAMTAGDIYTVAGTGTAAFSGDAGPATAAELKQPGGVAFDGAGNLVIADTHNNRIRVVAAATGTFYGQAMTAGDIYTLAGSALGFSGDGGPATSARLDVPQQVVVDAAGNLVIADSGNSRIRVVAEATGTFYGQAMTAGDIYTVAGNGTAGFSGDAGLATAAELNAPGGVAVDGAGDLVITDTGNSRIRVVGG